MAAIKHFLEIECDAGVVFNAVTRQEGIAGWWTPETVTEPVEGSISEFKFGDRYHNKMRIARLEPNRSVEWECLEGDDEWIGTRIVFDLEKRRGKTVLRFRHGDWRAETDFFASCNYNWGYYMHSLKQYCETGEGTPFSPAED